MSINMNGIEALIREHVEEQPYSISCYECGSVLDCDKAEVDNDLDLKLEVSPCGKCIENAVDEAKTEMESN